MGNRQYAKEAPVQEQNPDIALQLQQTKFEISDSIEGSVFFRMSQNKKPPFSVYIQVIGYEEGYYNFKQNDKSVYEYKIRRNKFFKCRKYLWQHISCQTEINDYQIEFKISPSIVSPSVDFKTQNKDVQCSIQYVVKAVFLWRDNKRFTHKDKCYQSIVYYKNCSQELRNAVPEEKIEPITTYKCFRSSKGLLFTSLKVDKKAYFDGDQVCAEVSLDNSYGNLNIFSAKLLFYLEFLMKERLFQGMPKYLIGEQDIGTMRQDEKEERAHFTIQKQDNLPHQSHGQKIACRYIVVLQIRFERFCTGVEDVEIIIPVEYFPSVDSVIPPAPEDSSNFKGALKWSSENQLENHELGYLNTETFYDERTRIAELTQIVK